MALGKAARKLIRDGLLASALGALDQVSLCGSHCPSCGETSLGANDVCPNCDGASVSRTPLSRSGTLWTYTVVRHKPPGNYQGPDPFMPFGLGLVELPVGASHLGQLVGARIGLAHALGAGGDCAVTILQA